MMLVLWSFQKPSSAIYSSQHGNRYSHLFPFFKDAPNAFYWESKQAFLLSEGSVINYWARTYFPGAV